MKYKKEMSAKSQKGMYGRSHAGSMQPDLTPAGADLGMNMGGKKRFVKMNLKDGACSNGHVMPISTNVANMG